MLGSASKLEKVSSRLHQGARQTNGDQVIRGTPTELRTEKGGPLLRSHNPQAEFQYLVWLWVPGYQLGNPDI